jgi:hypothetical protein
MIDSNSTKIIGYQCNDCGAIRNLGVLEEEHEKLLLKSTNGLVKYSDIHICQYGLTSVNELNVDAEYNVRSNDNVELPKFRDNINLIPSPKSGDEFKLINILQMPNKMDLHLIFFDFMLKTKIKIGRFDSDVSFPFTSIQSDMGMIKLDVFPTGTSFSPSVEIWLEKLISVLEVLPPTTLGLLIDTLQYISMHYHRNPDNFDITFIKTILASHEVYFEVLDKERTKIQKMKEEYGSLFSEDDFNMMDKFVRIMLENEYSAIKDFTSIEGVKMDLLSIIYLFVILEKEQIIRIERPGIIESNI